jgi:hypothetical protein
MNAPVFQFAHLTTVAVYYGLFYIHLCLSVFPPRTNCDMQS